MIPTNLMNRVELIFEEMGGYSGVKSLFTDNEIIDICLFNGFTDVIFPFFTSFEADKQNGLSLYTAMDLGVTEYKPQTKYYVVDKNFNSLYEDMAVEELIEGSMVPVYGHSERDKEFLSTTYHGQLLYILIQTPDGAGICQVIISHALPSSIIKLNTKRWALEQSKLSAPVNVTNELLVNIGNYSNVRVHYLEGVLKDNYNEIEVAHHIDKAIGEQGLNTELYLSFRVSTWFTLREYQSYIDFDTSQLVGLSYAEGKDLLAAEDFELVYTVGNGRYVFTKVLDGEYAGYTAEAVLQIDRNEDISYSLLERYRVLSFIDISGLNTEKLKRINNAYLIQINTGEVSLAGSLDTGKNQPQPLMTRASFKITAGLTH